MNDLEAPPTTFYEQNPRNPADYTKNKRWFDRSQYVNTLRGLIGSQLTQYKREENRIKKTKISQNIGYLVQVIGGMINHEQEILDRLDQIERVLDVKRKNK